MRLVQFYSADKILPGVFVGDSHIIDLQMAASIYSKALSDRIQDLKTLLQQGNRVLEEVRSLVENITYQLENNLQSIPDEVLLDAHHVRLAAPIHNPQKIIAIGLNYRDHCEENGLTPPEFPITFAKYPSAIIGPDEPIVWPPEITQEVDYEAEFAAVIGRTTRYVSEKQAMDYVAGYTIINDVSARDVQFADGQWVRAKSLDTFCPMGPALITRDEIPDPHCLELKCIVNGKILQQSNTRHLIFGVAYLVSYLSKSFTLFPGDIISTGTPGGVGYYRKPQVFLKPGDSVTIEIDKLGQLTNPVEKWCPPLAG